MTEPGGAAAERALPAAGEDRPAGEPAGGADRRWRYASAEHAARALAVRRAMQSSASGN